MVQTDVKLEQLSSRNLREAISQLDDRQIFSLIQQLIDERDTLLKRQDHLSSLSRLWEKTVTEADDIAKQVKEEAKQQAEAEAQSILAEAKQSADELLKQKQAEAIVGAQKEINATAVELKRDLDAFSARTVEELQIRLDETAKQAAEAAKAYIEALRGQFETFSKELDGRLSALEASAGQAKLDTAPVQPITDPQDKPQPAASDATTAMPVSTAAPAGPEAPPPAQAKPVASGERKVIEILSPRDMVMIDSVRAQLNDQDGVIETELQHQVDRTLIHVRLSKTVDLTYALSRMPEVERAQEVLFEGKPRTQIMLGVESDIVREKNMLNNRINRIARRIRPSGRD